MARKVVKMLSFDTSTTDSGWALWKNGILTDYGNIDLTKEKDINKVDEMSKRLISIIKQVKPDIIVCEDANVSKDIKTLKKLSEIIGVLRGCALSYPDCWFDKLIPGEWKCLIASENETIPTKREQCKAWSIKKTKELFDISTKNDNISDAILIGEAYKRLFSEKNADYKE